MRVVKTNVVVIFAGERAKWANHCLVALRCHQTSLDKWLALFERLVECRHTQNTTSVGRRARRDDCSTLKYRLESVIHTTSNALVLLGTNLGELANAALLQCLNLLEQSLCLLTLWGEKSLLVGIVEVVDNLGRVLAVCLVA